LCGRRSALKTPAARVVTTQVSAHCTKDIRNLLRAYNLLVATRDDERALVGRVSRKWLQSEREDWVALSDISPGVLATVRGREILCNAFLPDLDANPESINLDPLISQLPATDKLISSNSLPKLEPAVAGEVLLGVMLLGVQRYGNRKAGSSWLNNDVIVAAMVRDTLGLTDKYSAVMPGNCEKIELSTITELFGENVTAQMLSINSHHAEFLEAHANGETNKLKPGGT